MYDNCGIFVGEVFQIFEWKFHVTNVVNKRNINGHIVVEALGISDKSVEYAYTHRLEMSQESEEVNTPLDEDDSDGFFVKGVEFIIDINMDFKGQSIIYRKARNTEEDYINIFETSFEAIFELIDENKKKFSKYMPDDLMCLLIDYAYDMNSNFATNAVGIPDVIGWNIEEDYIPYMTEHMKNATIKVGKDKRYAVRLQKKIQGAGVYSINSDLLDTKDNNRVVYSFKKFNYPSFMNTNSSMALTMETLGDGDDIVFIYGDNREKSSFS